MVKNKDTMPIYLMASHNRIETDPNKSAHMLIKDNDYDLIDIDENKVVQTVKGRTIQKNMLEGKYKVSNLIPPKCEVYMFNCSKVAPSWVTIGILDFTHREAVLKDRGLNGFKFIGKKIGSKHLAVGVGNVVMDLVIETQSFNPLGVQMGVSNKENLLTIKAGNKILGTFNLKYNGRVDTIELQKRENTYRLRLNTDCDESGPDGTHSSIDISLN